MSTDGRPTARTAAHRAQARPQQRCGTPTRARLPPGATRAVAASLPLLLACAAWALPGALAAAASAAVALPQIKVNGAAFAGVTPRIVALPNSKFEIYVSVLNIGTANLAASQAVLRAWSQDSASFPDKACGEPGNASILVPGIGAGTGQSPIMSGIPAPSAVGTYTLRLFVDADCKVAEGDDSLAVHQATVAYQVVDPSTALPTFGVDIIWSDQNVLAGKKLKGLMRLYNFGAVPSRPGTLALIVSNHTDKLTPGCGGLPDAGGKWTALKPKVIPAGGTLDLFASVPVPKIKGQLALHVIVNAACAVAEDTSIEPVPHYEYAPVTA